MSTATAHMMYAYRQARLASGETNVGYELPPRGVTFTKAATSPVVRSAQPRDGSRTRRGVEFRYQIDSAISLAQIAELGKSVDGVEFPQEVWAKWLSDDTKVRTIAAYAGNRLAGYVRASFDSKSPETALVEDAMVRPAYQGLGVFKRMITLGMGQLAEDGVREVTFSANPGTEGMYQHLGFTGVDAIFRGEVPIKPDQM